MRDSSKQCHALNSPPYRVRTLFSDLGYLFCFVYNGFGEFSEVLSRWHWSVLNL